MRTLLDRFESKYIPEPNSGCWLWEAAVVQNGYGTISVNKGMRRAHRVSYELYVGNIPDNLMVLHKCDVRCCVNPDHLFLGTHQDNMDDREFKGRGALPPPNVYGRRLSKDKLTDANVIDIRLKYKPRLYTLLQLSIEYDVSASTIRRIIHEPNWRGEL